jgi:hypothetical protein
MTKTANFFIILACIGLIVALNNVFKGNMFEFLSIAASSMGIAVIGFIINAHHELGEARCVATVRRLKYQIKELYFN